MKFLVEYSRYRNKAIFINSSRQERKGKRVGHAIKHFARYLIFSNEPVNQVSGGNIPWFIDFANFYGIKILPMASFKLPKWCHYMQNLKEMHKKRKKKRDANLYFSLTHSDFMRWVLLSEMQWLGNYNSWNEIGVVRSVWPGALLYSTMPEKNMCILRAFLVLDIFNVLPW